MAGHRSLHFGEQRHAALARHALIGDDDADGLGFLFEHGHRRRGAVGRQDAEVLVQALAEVLQRLLLVIDVEHGVLAGLGLCDCSCGTPYCSGGQREIEAHFGPLAQLTVDLHRAPVVLDDRVADAEPQPHPLARRLGGEERIEKLWQIGRRPRPCRCRERRPPVVRRRGACRRP